MSMFTFGYGKRSKTHPYRNASGVEAPQPHHYFFAYQGFANYVFTNPSRVISLFGAPENLVNLWRKFGDDTMAVEDRLNDIAPTLKDSDAHPIANSIVICFRMPPPVTNGEAFFVGLVLAKRFATGEAADDANLRYFVLSRCGAKEGFLREVIHEKGENDYLKHYALNHVPTRARVASFVAAIKDELTKVETSQNP